MRLEEQGHRSGVAMEVDGTYIQTFRVIWGYTTNDGMRRCYQDEEQTTEWAACGIALLLIQKLTDYAPISRSRKGTGFDYWLGTHQDTDDNIFLNQARLEVSGIRKGSDTQINRRLREKIDQPNPSNSTLLSVYAVVVEFSRPTIQDCSEMNIRELHNHSMDLAETAVVARLQGDDEKAATLFQQAFELELKAAETLRSQLEVEPTRSILYRSAASLALDCGDWQQAEHLIVIGLSGYPPTEIADEMRDLLRQTLFARRLEIKGLVLSPNDITISIAGEDTGLGVAPSDIVLDRLSNFKTLADRTAERRASQPYRSAGTSKISSKYPLYLRAFAPGSFTVILTIGHPRQPALPTLEDLDPAVDIVKEILDCIELLNQREEDTLKHRIADPAYFNNFVALMNKIAPDGESVQRVGFTTVQNGIERNVPLLRKQADISRIPKLSSVSGEGVEDR